MQTGEQREGEDSAAEKERGEGGRGEGRGGRGEGKKGEKEIERVKRRKRMILYLCTHCVLHFMQHEAGGLFPKKRKGGNYALINSNIIICLLWQHPVA